MTTPPQPVDPRLRRLLGGAELAAVRARLRRHFERNDPDTAATPLRLNGLDPSAHQALCQLTGRPSRPARSIVLDIVELDTQLRAAGLAHSLRDALEQLEGPIVPHAKLKRDLQARWTMLAASATVAPRLRAWLDSPPALTLLKRLRREPDQAAHLLAAADAVLARLPADGLPRAQLAAETLGDAHALDAGWPVATLVLAAWRHGEHAQPSFTNGNDDTSDDDQEPAEDRLRDQWARAGILVNELARPVLFLNLPPPSGGSCSWIPGEPGYLSLRHLLRRHPVWPVAGRLVFVCENPNIVAIAADHLGADCAPLVCTDGMPAAAQRTLLGQLAAAGADLRYHGDYDWPGIDIGNYVIRTWRATAWRFRAEDYLAAAAATNSLRISSLETNAADACWDPGLGLAMREHKVAIAEEAVVNDLLRDLSSRAGQ